MAAITTSKLGGKAVDATQKYELIRPILKGEKTPKQVSEETNIPISTIYRYLKRYGESGEDIKSLADRSHANLSHPKWFTLKDRGKVVQYKLHHPHLSGRQIAKALAKEGILQINYHSVTDILRKHDLTAPFLSTDHTN
jgi:transposase